MKQSFLLAWRALVRGHVLTLLLVATALAHLLLPALVRSDGTAEGWREMFVRAVPGTTYAFTVIAILACACGFFAQERERFSIESGLLYMVGVAFGKWLALCLVGVLVYSFTAVLTLVHVPDPPPCMHHFAPTLPPPVEKAREMMDEYLANPKTPEFVKKAPRSAVLRLLTNKELDRYDVVRSGASMSWPFDPSLAGVTNMLVRVRFATQFDLRSPLEGVFTLGEMSAVVSNKTQSVVNVPLKRVEKVERVGKVEEGEGLSLMFTNTGKELVMLRPRRDLEVLVPADSFGMNLARAVVQMLVVTALLSAFGLFLSSALSRPVAVFTSLVTVAVALMAPSVVIQFPDEIETTLSNKIGLLITRTVYALTSTAGEMEPVSALATDSCIEWGELLKCTLVSGVLLPLLLLGATAFIVRRKPLADHS